MTERMTKNLVSQFLWRAIAAKRPAVGLIHNSDRKSQYCAQEFALLLDRFGMRASMSRKGNCYNNAPMESFWACSRMNRSTIANMQPDKRLYRILQSTSRFSITGKGNRPGSASCLPSHMNDGSMKNDWQHESFGVHY
jgi:transposase InsO family protein